MDAVGTAERLAARLRDPRPGSGPERWRRRPDVRRARQLARRLAAPAGTAGAAGAAPPAVEQARALGLFPAARAAGARPSRPSRRAPAARRPARAAARLAAAACLALSRLALDAGNVPEAYTRLRQAGRFLTAPPAPRRLWVWGLVLVPEHAAAVTAATGRAERATRLGAAGAALRAARGRPLAPAAAAWFDRYLLPAQRALAGAARARARAVGRALPLLGAVTEALEVAGFPRRRRAGGRRGNAGAVGLRWPGLAAVLPVVHAAVEGWALAGAGATAAVG